MRCPDTTKFMTAAMMNIEKTTQSSRLTFSNCLTTFTVSHSLLRHMAPATPRWNPGGVAPLFVSVCV